MCGEIYSKEKIIGKKKKKVGESVPSLEVIEVYLVQCNLVDDQYQKSLKYCKIVLQISLMHTFQMLKQVILRFSLKIVTLSLII